MHTYNTLPSFLPFHDNCQSTNFYHFLMMVLIMESFKNHWRSFKRHTTLPDDAAPPAYVGPGIDCPSEKTKKPSQTSQRSNPLADLPTDLLVNITNQLDPVSVQCLRLTGKRFYTSLNVNEELLSRCGKWLVMARIEQDAIDEYIARPLTTPTLPPETISVPKAPDSFSFGRFHWKGASHKVDLQKDGNSQEEEKPENQPSELPQYLQRLTCSLCKIKHPHSAFMSNSVVGCHNKSVAVDISHLSSSNIDPLLNIRSLERLCAQHTKGTIGFKLCRDDEFQGDRWLAYRKDFCLHCGLCRNDPSYKLRCRCRTAFGQTPTCSVCPCIKLRCFERQYTTDNKSLESCVFLRNQEGRLTVRESLKSKSESP